MCIIMNIKKSLNKIKTHSSIPSEVEKVEVSKEKNRNILTLDDLRKISLTFDISHSSISSSMNKKQKYKTKYGKILRQAEVICKYYGKRSR